MLVSTIASMNMAIEYNYLNVIHTFSIIIDMGAYL